MEFDPIEYYEGLNPQQHAAVFSKDKYLCLLAIPGSGKTHALIGKIIHLIDSEQIYSHEITAITFTNKAAKELRERVNKFVGEVEGESITIGTFHSLCVRILIQHGYKISLDKFSILDDKTSKKKIRNIAKKYINDSTLIDVKKIKGMISKWKKALVSPKRAFQNAGTSDQVNARIYNDYYNECRSENNLDFDDLIVKTILLLKRHPSVRDRVRRDIKFLLVDESQDTNDIQFRLIKLLLRNDTRLFMVADDDQSIYGFRGAEPKYVLNFKKIFKDGKILKLEQNYRSTKNIVNAANSLIDYNKNRKKKKAFTENIEGSLITLNNCSTSYAEATYVMEEIKNLVNFNGYEYKDIAVLYRLNSQSRKIEDELNRENIPYHIIGSTSFYDRMEIKDVMAYFKLIVNNKDKESFERIMGLQSGIGDKSIERLINFAKENDYDYIETLNQYNKKPRIISRLKPLKDLITVLKIKTDEQVDDPSVVLDEILAKTKYISYLKSKYSSNFDERKDNVSEIYNIINSYMKNNSEEFRSMQDFINQLSLNSSETEEPDTLKMLTIHSAKGLEFPIVFIIGVQEKLLPYALSLKENKVEEERRLFYVGMTRAEKKLYLSYPDTDYNFSGKPVNVSPSRFLTEIESKFIKDYQANSSFDNFEVDDGDDDYSFAI